VSASVWPPLVQKLAAAKKGLSPDNRKGSLLIFKKTVDRNILQRKNRRFLVKRWASKLQKLKKAL